MNVRTARKLGRQDAITGERRSVNDPSVHWSQPVTRAYINSRDTELTDIRNEQDTGLTASQRRDARIAREEEAKRRAAAEAKRLEELSAKLKERAERETAARKELEALAAAKG